MTGISSRHVTKPTRSTQPCIHPGLLNRVPALVGWGKGGNVVCAGVTGIAVWSHTARELPIAVRLVATSHVSGDLADSRETVVCVLRTRWSVVGVPQVRSAVIYRLRIPRLVDARLGVVRAH